MVLKKIQIKLKGSHGARGTRESDQMLEMLKHNWDEIQEKFQNASESEKEDYLDHFNANFENLGDSLFGDEAGIEAITELVNGYDEQQKVKFCEIVDDVFNFE